MRLHDLSWEGADRLLEHRRGSSEGREGSLRASRAGDKSGPPTFTSLQEGSVERALQAGPLAPARDAPRRGLTTWIYSPSQSGAPATRPRLAAYTCPQSTRTGFSYTSRHTGHVKRPSGSASAADPASCAPPSPSCRCSAILLPRNAAQQRPRRRSLTGRGRGGGRVRARGGERAGPVRSGPLGAGIKECAPGWGGASGWVTPFWPL